MTICAYTLHQTTTVSNQTSHSLATRVDECVEVPDGKVPGGNLEASPDTRRIHARPHMDPRLHPVGSSRQAELARLADKSGTAHRGSHTPPRVASFTATQGRYSPRGITLRSESPSDSGRVSPTGGDTDEDFIVKRSEVVILRQEYSEFITLKDNAEIVLAEAMEATEWLNTEFS
ncbi:hypothetical protein M422DRAFT_274814 [Sphaerobolus stellatus SS14]|uniref:Uncharacterized protein n=1 Tax=Sphaerobolus stellatus (strain SS14) TaxID=990650 RepID=A0A0C9U5R4_SPHS4|nr:hypothetical protein M422DRAFT_274814 [Sphaerobolus stellatus SS14]